MKTKVKGGAGKRGRCDQPEKNEKRQRGSMFLDFESKVDATFLGKSVKEIIDFDIELNFNNGNTKKFTLLKDPSTQPTEQITNMEDELDSITSIKINGTTFTIGNYSDISSIKTAYAYICNKCSTSDLQSRLDRFYLFVAIGKILNADFEFVYKTLLSCNKNLVREEKQEKVDDLSDLFASMFSGENGKDKMNTTKIANNAEAYKTRFTDYFNKLVENYESLKIQSSEDKKNTAIKQAKKSIKKFKQSALNFKLKYDVKYTGYDDRIKQLDNFYTRVEGLSKNSSSIEDVNKILDEALNVYKTIQNIHENEMLKRTTIENLAEQLRNLNVSSFDSIKDDFTYSSETIYKSLGITSEIKNYLMNISTINFFDADLQTKYLRECNIIDNDVKEYIKLQKRVESLDEIEYDDLKNMVKTYFQNLGLPNHDDINTCLHRMFFYFKQINFSTQPRTSGGKLNNKKHLHPLKQLRVMV